MRKKKVAILGSTGSIGTQTLQVVEANPDLFEITLLTANNNLDLLIEQAHKFKPQRVVIGNSDKFAALSEALNYTDIEVLSGTKALSDCMSVDDSEIVLSSLVGFSGLLPTIKAIEAKKNIALANKETLVVAGCLINKLIHEYSVSLLPVDSEHSAIFQCLLGEKTEDVEKIYITASGGPFRGKQKEQLLNITKHEALKHPNWNMGAKITIDSASMMNKGLEVIEAKWLFNLKNEQIDVIVHPQSIIHSIVQFIDGSMKAQMGLPDMKVPIQFALSYPDRILSSFPRLNFADYHQLTFEKPDLKTFRNLALAYDALHQGGIMPCILNAANEVAVDAFLKDKIKFLSMPDVIEKTMSKMKNIQNPNYTDFVECDIEARQITLAQIE